MLDASLTDSGEGVLGHIIEVAPKEKDGYTPNATTATGMLTEDATFNVYYENDAYKFETQTLNAVNNTTIKKEVMTGVPATDMQPNTYKITRAHTGDYSHDFKYTADNVGKYLVFNVYYTAMSNVNVIAWNAAGTQTVPVVSLYDGAGNLQPSNAKEYYLNKWVNVVVYLDEAYYKDKTSFRFTLANWSGATEVYFGEYTFLTEEQFKANFQYIETDTAKLPEGVVGYKGESLTYFSNAWGVNCLGGAFNGMKLYTSKGDHFSECGVIPSGVTKWSAGQYVAVRAYSYTATGAMIGLYAQTRVAILDDAGNEVEAAAVQANQWYTYVFKIGENDVTISKYSGSITVATGTTAGIKFLFESVYSIADDTAYAAFKTWKGWKA